MDRNTRQQAVVSFRQPAFVSRGGDAELDIAEEEDFYITRKPTSTRRYHPSADVDTGSHPVVPVRRRAGAVQRVTTQQQSPRMARGGVFGGLRVHPLFLIGVGMIVMVLGWMALNWAGTAWQMHNDDSTYGNPRTYQVDAVVGHQDSTQNPSHFIFLNLNGYVEIIEFPGGDPSHARVYPGPKLVASGSIPANLIPVTGTFADVNHDGKIDLILHIQGGSVVFLNDGSKFVEQK